MNETILLGQGREIIPMPRAHWEEHLSGLPEHSRSRLAFMSPAHHLVRNFVVRQLPTIGGPISPAEIAESLNLNVKQVAEVLNELEKNLFFLVRDLHGAVTWAFPVTVEPTPHQLTFESGEQIYAAWAEDAIATPFVQGRLRDRPLSVEIHTRCVHCDQPLRFTVDDNLRCQVYQPGAEPLVFQPHVDWDIFTDPNIIHAYWRNSVFFWSEEHAREYRSRTSQVDGIYLTLEQSAYATPITQGALFGFWGAGGRLKSRIIGH